jgi:Cu-Zn family superoxide dismutase
MLRHPRLRVALAAAVLAGALVAGATFVSASGRSGEVPGIAVTLAGAAGKPVAVASIRDAGDGTVSVRVRAWGLPPGFHGMHVHAVGACEPPEFTSAGGHLKAEGTSHPGHTGDLPSLYVKGDGTASARFETDRFGLADLRDADGSALVIHAGADNFANVPPRYAPGGPDQMTRDTGDSGARIACGPIG